MRQLGKRIFPSWRLPWKRQWHRCLLLLPIQCRRQVLHPSAPSFSRQVVRLFCYLGFCWWVHARSLGGHYALTGFSLIAFTLVVSVLYSLVCSTFVCKIRLFLLRNRTWRPGNMHVAIYSFVMTLDSDKGYLACLDVSTVSGSNYHARQRKTLRACDACRRRKGVLRTREL